MVSMQRKASTRHQRSHEAGSGTARTTLAATTAALALVLLAGCGSSGSSAGGSSSSTSPAAATSSAPSPATSSSSAPSAGTSSTTPQAAATIHIMDFKYKVPASVAPGATVSVMNMDQTNHTVTADTGGAFDVKATAGKTTTFVAPTKPGSYPFHCTYHANMHGVLVVK